MITEVEFKSIIVQNTQIEPELSKETNHLLLVCPEHSFSGETEVLVLVFRFSESVFQFGVVWQVVCKAPKLNSHISPISQV